jgi:hypothetical protein
LLNHIFVILSAWFLLSVIVGLLAGRALSNFPEAPAPGFVPFPEDHQETAAFNELEEEEMEVLAYARTP